MLKDDRDYMDSVYKRLDLLTRSKTYRDVDKDVAHLHRRIYRAAVFKLNHASRDPITHDQLMLEMFGMLTEDNMYLLAAKMDLPPVLEKPNALVRINNILMDTDNLSAVPGLPKVAVERLQDAKKSIVAVQEQIKAKPWTPMPAFIPFTTPAHIAVKSINLRGLEGNRPMTYTTTQPVTVLNNEPEVSLPLVPEQDPVPETISEPPKPVEEVQLSQSLLQLPEIQLLVNFYNTTINRLREDRTQQPYLKKLKLKRLQNEYKQVVLWIQGVSKLMVQLETDPDNIQTQADINVIGKLFAERITKLVLSHGLKKGT